RSMPRLYLLRARRTPVLANGADFPCPIFLRHADRARPVARRARRALVEEKHALHDIAAARDSAQRGRTVLAPKDPRAAVAPKRPPPRARVRPSVSAQERPGLALCR